MKTEKQGVYSVESDGTTVWVNNLMGWCVGRFGPTGYDFNNLLSMLGGYKASGSDGRTNLKDWAAFSRLMRGMFGVMVGDMHKPSRLDAS